MADTTRIFYEALEVPTAELPGYLERACDDPARRGRIARLLDPDASIVDFQAPVLRGIDEDITGHKLDHFYIHKLIGRGGTADVYLATDTRPRSFSRQVQSKNRLKYRVTVRPEVALKILRTIGRPEDHPGEHFRIEEITSALERIGYVHEKESVQRMHEVLPYSPENSAWAEAFYSGSYQGRPYFVMPHYPLTLADRPHAFEVTHLAEYLAAPLDHLHINGLLHRDVKPANIFLIPLSLETVARNRQNIVHNPFFLKSALDNTVYRAVIGDFSLLHRIDTPSAVSPNAGTLAYAPPEIIIGDPATPATDQYALAATVYHHYTGRPPFVADTAEEMLRAILVGVIDPDFTRPDVTPVFQRALSKLPSERFPTCLEFAGALSDALPFEPMAPTELAEL